MTALAGLALSVLVVPMLAVLTRVDWARLGPLLSANSSRAALWLSLWTATASTALCLLLGLPLAVLLARSHIRGLVMLRALVLVPLVLPPVVAGMALLATFGRQGLLGHALQVAGVRVAFTSLAVVIAQTFVALPYLVLSLEAALRSQGERHEEVAATLGASRTFILRTVTLPLLAPAVGSGAALAFARCLGEFGATLTFAGSLQGVTRTLSLEIYLQREVDPRAALALSLVLIALAVVVVAITRGRQAWR